MLQEILREVRGNLRKKGWGLILYSSLGFLKTHNSTGLCDEEAKKILLATKGLSRKKILWLLAHEYSHFQQYLWIRGERRRRLDQAYLAYTRMTDSRERIEKSKLSEVRELIIEYEYQADQMAYKLLETWNVSTQGFRVDANSYNFVIRYAFLSGTLINQDRGGIARELQIQDRWLSKRERNRPLNPREIEVLRAHGRRILGRDLTEK